MTEQTRIARLRLRTGAIAAGAAMALTVAFGAVPAHADVLDELAEEYSTGAGAGQVANLLRASLELRQQGIRPKPGDLLAVKDALAYRPNQGPLIEALGATVAHQQKTQQQMAGSQGQAPIQVGVTNEPWNPGNPMQDRETEIFPIPGR